MASQVRVAIVSAGLGEGGGGDGAELLLPFGFGARCVQAALLEPAMQGVEVSFIEADAPDPAAILAEIERFDADVIGGSAYVWSLPALLEVAREAKLRRPDRKVVLGGPSARPEMFAFAPYAGAEEWVDALVFGEGEQTMRDILALPEIDAAGLSTVRGLAIPTASGFVTTLSRQPTPLDALPSPHELGLVAAPASGFLETYRGCPLSCGYCQWGVTEHLTESRSEASLVRQLEALRACGVTEVYDVDAGLNLNRRALRCLAAAEREVGLFRSAALVAEVYATHVKDEDVELFAEWRIGRIGVGLQSFNPDVLQYLRRPFDSDRFVHGVERLAEVSPPLIEVILGLPGDSPDSFRRTVERALELPCQSVTVFHCLALPDALMTRPPPGADIDFDPHTLQVRSCKGWSVRDIEQARAYVETLVDRHGGTTLEGTWVIDGRRPAQATAPVVTDDARSAALAARLGRAAGQAVQIGVPRRLRAAVALEIEIEGARLTLLLRRRGEGPVYAERGDVAFSYRAHGASPNRQALMALDRIINALAPEAAALLDDASRS